MTLRVYTSPPQITHSLPGSCSSPRLSAASRSPQKNAVTLSPPRPPPDHPHLPASPYQALFPCQVLGKHKQRQHEGDILKQAPEELPWSMVGWRGGGVDAGDSCPSVEVVWKCVHVRACGVSLWAVVVLLGAGSVSVRVGTVARE